MITVFIDTNIYEELGFNFSLKNDIIANFIKHIDNKEVKNVIISVIDNEVKSHLTQRKLDNESKIKKHCKWIKNYIDEETINENLNSELESFEEFKKLSQAEVFELNTINTEKVLEKHFKKEYPFEKSKPYEFKDAFFVEGVKRYVEDNYSIRNIIVTKDKGIKQAVKNIQNIETISSIQELSDLIINYGKERKDTITKYLDKYNLDKQLKEICSVSGDNDFEEGNIEVEEITKNGVWGTEILSIKPDRITIVCDLGIILKGSFSCLDIENSVYDSEDKDYIYKTYLEKSELMYVCLAVLDIKIKNSKMSDVIIKDFPEIEIEYKDLKNK